MILERYLIKQFVPVFFVASAMFVLLISLVDLFTNLARYLANEVSVSDIFLVSFFYLPKSFSYALPISMLFATAYTLGDLYARNELTSVFAAGVPFWRFSRPLIIIGILASIFSFFFEDYVVIPTLKRKNELSRILLRQPHIDFRSDIVVKARDGWLTYAVDFFDSQTNALFGVSIIEQDENGQFVSLIRALRADWSGEYWLFTNAGIYQWSEDGFLRYGPLERTDQFREEPDTFRRQMMNVDELSFRDVRHLIRDLQIAGLPFVHAQADFYQRFSFAVVPFIVIMLSISMGGRFRKNILLMSLVSSLFAAVVFYVTEMVTMMMARLGIIHPFIGAWFPVFVFIIVGVLLLRTAKT